MIHFDTYPLSGDYGEPSPQKDPWDGETVLDGYFWKAGMVPPSGTVRSVGHLSR